MAISEARASPKLKNSLFISLLAENLGVETGSPATASATIRILCSFDFNWLTSGFTNRPLRFVS
jgi:hypothetical protein